MSNTVGIDVGGTKCLGVALDADGTVVAEDRRPTPRGPGSLPRLIDTLAELSTVLGPYDELGVGVPGLVTNEGVLRAAPNLDGVADFDVAGHGIAIWGVIQTVAPGATIEVARVAEESHATDVSIVKRIAHSLREHPIAEWPNILSLSFGSPACLRNPNDLSEGYIEPVALRHAVDVIDGLAEDRPGGC